VESKRKQLTLRQKAAFELKLKDRLSFLSEKGVKSPKADKDTLARKLKADIKAMNSRLKLLAENEKRTEEMAKIKAERAAAPKIDAAPEKAPAAAKGEKSKKAPVEGKEKKIKTEKKPAAPKAPEGDKS
jgi:hypothetical protein